MLFIHHPFPIKKDKRNLADYSRVNRQWHGSGKPAWVVGRVLMGTGPGRPSATCPKPLPHSWVSWISTKVQYMSEEVGSVAVRQSTSKCGWLGRKCGAYRECREASDEQTTSY